MPAPVIVTVVVIPALYMLWAVWALGRPPKLGPSENPEQGES
ncbi:hypothetical protein [Nocardia sp. NPDC049707]